ncbi:ESF1 -like protein, partial [Brachionus plicatilis]
KNKSELTEEEKKEQARLSLLTMDNEDHKSHFNLDDLLLDKKQKKNKKKLKCDDEEKKEDNFEVNLKDPRFEAIFTDHRFNIDPSDQLFKKTKAMENILNEKVKRIKEGQLAEDRDEDDQVDKNESNGVSLLVKSIKSKTESLKRKKDHSKFNKNKKFNN